MWPRSWGRGRCSPSPSSSRSRRWARSPPRVRPRAHRSTSPGFDDFAVRSQVYAADGSLLATLHGEREPPAGHARPGARHGDRRRPRGRGRRLLPPRRRQPPGHRPGPARERPGRRDRAGRLDHHPAAGQERAARPTSGPRPQERRRSPLAIRLEKQMTKDEILETYLNTVYFGSGAYGVQAAAETYWGKDVGELDWAEGAMLAASSPTRSPTTRRCTPRRPEQRQHRARPPGRPAARSPASEADRSARPPLPVRPVPVGRRRRPAELRRGVQLPESRTTSSRRSSSSSLDDPSTSAAHQRRALQRGVRRRARDLHDPRPGGAGGGRDGASRDIAARPNDKGITVAHWCRSSRPPARCGPWSAAPASTATSTTSPRTTPGRQTGSSFKIFVLLTALEQGNLPDRHRRRRRRFAEPGRRAGPLHGRRASAARSPRVTSASSNGAFVRLGQIVGIENVIDMARRLGHRRRDFDPSGHLDAARHVQG